MRYNRQMVYDIRMTKSIVTLVLTSACLSAADDRMVYIVPSDDRKSATVVFSETLEPAEKTDIHKLSEIKLYARVDNKDILMKLKAGKDSIKAEVPNGTIMIHGTLVYGLAGNDNKRHLVVYHPKCVFAPYKAEGQLTAGQAFKSIRTTTRLGESAKFELVPIIGPELLLFQALASDKPVQVKGTVLEPDGEKLELATDPKVGVAPTTERIPNKPGRHAAHFEYTEAKAGKYNGDSYQEVRHYATLVIDLGR